jgi:hypothetical protein
MNHLVETVQQVPPLHRHENNQPEQNDTQQDPGSQDQREKGAETELHGLIEAGEAPETGGAPGEEAAQERTAQ